MEIYVEEKLGDVFIVHDGGKTTAELFSQGIHVRDSKRAAVLKNLAGRYGATFDNGSFSVACHRDGIQDAVLSIAQCTTLAMFDLLRHVPVVEDEPMVTRVGRALERWRPADVEVRKKLHIRGVTQDADHVFDYVTFGRGQQQRNNVAVNVLTPTYSPELQAHSYGFLVKDISGTIYEAWPRLAVVARTERWDPREIKLVRSLAKATLELSTAELDTLDERLPPMMNQLAA
jgi:hypothetical protein